MCTFLLQNGALSGLGQMHCGICEINMFILQFHLYRCISAGTLNAHKRLVISGQYWNKNWSSHDLLLSYQGIIPLEVNHITVTSHERHDVSDHQQLDCLFNRSFKLITIDPSKSYILGPLRGDHRWPVGSPHRGSVMREAFLWHGVTLSLKYNHSS